MPPALPGTTTLHGKQPASAPSGSFFVLKAKGSEVSHGTCPSSMLAEFKPGLEKARQLRKRIGRA